MTQRLRRAWQALSQGKPGRRFQDRYYRRRTAPAAGGGRALRIGGAIALVPIGVILLAIPGPGLPVLALAAVLLAQESLATARALDACERWLRRRGSGSTPGMLP